ncbi:MAG TPA: ankyrin repeat domain-containing protein [Pyrinomonadaceae bacterium]
MWNNVDMNAKFHPAMKAIKADDLETFKNLIAEDPSLATSGSTKSHPTLLQCLVLDGKGKSNAVQMAKVLIDAGAELNGPLVAASSIDNREVAELLLDRGAAVDGTGGWSPLEEALYWNNRNVIALLLERGARVQNLRIAAGLGRTDLIEGFFNADSTLKPEAGKIDWPFGNLEKIADRVNAWSQDQQGIMNNAFVYACMHGHIEAAKLLLDKGAEINVIPGGFDYAGTGLHYAALNGHREMVEFLLQHGSDPNIRDTKVGSTAAGWAEYGHHSELLDLLR